MKNKFKNNRKRNYSLIIVGVLIIIVILILMLTGTNLKNKKNLDTNLSSHNKPAAPINISTTLIYNSAELTKNLTKEQIIGKWIVTKEEVNGVENENPAGELSFDSEDNYFSTNGYFNDSGKYKVEDEKITFYYTPEGYNISAVLDEARGNVNGTIMTLIYPSYPKVIVYKKE
jgi:hypothetical protein